MPYRRLRQILICLQLALIALTAQAQLTVTVNGNNIYWSTPPGYCCGGASLGAVFNGGAACSQPPCDYAPGRSSSFVCNRPGDYLVTGCWFNDSNNKICETKPATVVEPAPLTCPIFQLGSTTGFAVTRKFGSEPWPTGQVADGKIRISFKAVRVDPGTTIHFKVIDPPDAAEYRSNPVANDNFDAAAGRIALSPDGDGSSSLSITVPESGLLDLYLTTSQFAAGDNYIVRASPDANLLSDPNFVCGDACKETLPITALKRVYLEQKRMFRVGGLVRGEWAAGQSQVGVVMPSGMAFSPGNSVRLIHAPDLLGPVPECSFYSEDKVIAPNGVVKVSKDEYRLTFIEPLEHSYSHDLSVINAVERGLADGVGLPTAGYFERNSLYVPSAFNSAFVEFRDVPQIVTEVPYRPALGDIFDFANKWFENSPRNTPMGPRPGNPNVKHVLAGTGLSTKGGLDYSVLGRTVIEDVKTPSANASWTFAAAIEEAVKIRSTPVYRLDSLMVVGENVVHELAHTWGVNYDYHDPESFGHCTQVMALHPTKACNLSRSSLPEAGDGITGFHWLSDSDSEYMTIRRRTEPLPAP